MIIANLERYILPSNDQMSAELSQARGETLPSEIHKLINSVLNKEELPGQCRESVTTQFYKKGDKTVYTNYREISLLSTAPIYKKGDKIECNNIMEYHCY
jgi:hypothetical protein